MPLIHNPSAPDLALQIPPSFNDDVDGQGRTVRVMTAPGRCVIVPGRGWAWVSGAELERTAPNGLVFQVGVDPVSGDWSLPDNPPPFPTSGRDLLPTPLGPSAVTPVE